MRKIHLTFVLGLVIFLCLIILIALNLKSSAITITVDDSSGADYTTIQEAIDNSSSGDTVYVFEGTYYEDVLVNKSINLIGKDKNDTIIDGNGDGEGVVVVVNQVSILNFTITNGTYGIYIDQSDENNIMNNIVSNNSYGVKLYGSEKNTMANNIINNNIKGIQLTFSSRNKIMINNISNSDDYGIYLGDSDKNKVTSNFISYNKIGIYVYNTWDTDIIGNNISSNKCGIRIDSGINNQIYHNNFIKNTEQSYSDATNNWDNGYPIGGNYWSDYIGTDHFSGPEQDIPGGDLTGDIPYNINGQAFLEDNYPLIFPAPTGGIISRAPSAPLNLSATSGDSYVNITWIPSFYNGGSEIINYLVYRGTNSSEEILLTSIENILYYNDTDIIPGKTYYYRISAVNGIGEGPPSIEVNATVIRILNNRNKTTEEANIFSEPWFMGLIIIILVIIFMAIILIIRKKK